MTELPRPTWRDQVPDPNKVDSSLVDKAMKVGDVTMYDVIKVMMQFQAQETAEYFQKSVEEAWGVRDNLVGILECPPAWNSITKAVEDLREAYHTEGNQAKESHDEVQSWKESHSVVTQMLAQIKSALASVVDYDEDNTAIDIVNTAIHQIIGLKYDISALNILIDDKDKEMADADKHATGQVYKLRDAITEFMDWSGRITWDDFKTKYGQERNTFSAVLMFTEVLNETIE